MRRALVAVVFLVSAAARGDTFQATLDGPLVEVSHEVEVTLAGGVALYKVRRVFANPGQRADEATVEITLPYGAAATGLRIRARDRWYDADFLGAAEAEHRYMELTGMGKYQPKDPALLAWMWAGELLLRVFPVMPGGASTVEYTLVAPTRYDRGRVFVSYPRAGEGKLVPPILRVHPTWGDALVPLFVDGKRVPPDAPVVLTATAAIERPEFVPDAAGWVTSSIEVPAEADGALAEVEIEVSVEHTYRSDLTLLLEPPHGEPLDVVVQTGGDANDVREKRTLHLPAGARAAGRWRLHVMDTVARDSGTLVAWSLRGRPTGRKPFEIAADDLPLFVPDAQEAGEAGVALIEVAPPSIDTVAARLGRVPAGSEQPFVRLELDVAPELRPLPWGVEVVFVIDASRSVTAEQVSAQLAIARAYLSHVRDARAEVVVFRRHATRLFGRFVTPREWDGLVPAALRDGRLERQNGSAVDEALALAGTLSHARVRRVVATTDALFRDRLEVAGIAPLPAGTILHVVVPSVGEGTSELERDDDHAFAAVPAATGGIWARLDEVPACPAPPCPDEIKRLAPAVLGLVRPVRLDHLTVSGFDVPDTLEEGRGVRIFARGTGPVVLEARLWNQPYRRELVVDPAFSRQAAGFVFGEDEHEALSERDQLVVATQGRVVSPVTSYLAVEPGTRPSRVGLQRGRGAAVPRVMVGQASMGGMMGKLPTLDTLLRPIAERCAAAHHTSGPWKLDVETTRDEIADVMTQGGPDGPARACLIEGIWAFSLPGEYRRITRRQHSLALP